MNEDEFRTTFAALAGTPGHFPWQWELYKHFIAGAFPSSCNLPTGLGKTSVIHLWLLALATCPDKVPRRLVYVVNRRTVVDQSTDEAVRMRDRLRDAPALAGITAQLRTLCAFDDPEQVPLAISTLRGQFADNREWSADPSRPAVICGTVDMIGSRLLFSGYGCGFKTRPLHAGFLGQDSLLVHDEAHLEPALQTLLEAIRDEQGREPCPLGEKMRLRVMELTATSRIGAATPFELTPKDHENSIVTQRISATKRLHLHPLEKKLADDIVSYTEALTAGERPKDKAILIFVREVKAIDEIVRKLPKGQVQQLTGTIRGLERDRMADPRKEDGCPIFARFLKPPEERAPPSEQWKIEPKKGTVYLVCTSAGEVGVNLSADHLVCDLSTFESMAQRFGRVNRFGTCPETEIHVLYSTEFPKDELGLRLKRSLGLLELLKGNASPSALTDLRDRASEEGASKEPASTDHVQALREFVHANQETDPRLGGYAPTPTILPTSDILFDAWALTTLRELPGRPPVAEYLHGVEDDKQRETHIAWRAEVEPFHEAGVSGTHIAELLDEFPLRPHELLGDATWRIQDKLAALGEGQKDVPVWVIDPDDTVRVLTLGRLGEKDKKGYAENLSGRTVLLPPGVGGLTETGTFDGAAGYDAERKYDIAGWSRPAARLPLVRLFVGMEEEEPTYTLVAPVLDLPADFQFQLEGTQERTRLREVFPHPMRVAYRLDLRTDEDASAACVGYLVLKPEPRKEEAKYAPAWPALDGHLAGVKQFAEAICSRLHLPDEIKTAATLAGGWHDRGKDRAVWQRGAGNARGDAPVAKTLHGRPPENLNGFRHELASLVDVCSDPAFRDTFAEQTPDCREVLLHLIATHHGRGRPHFPAGEVTDPDRSETGAQTLATDTPGRFATLQRKYGRWGLAYLESLLRAADALDSKRIDETPLGARQAGSGPRPVPSFVWPERTLPTPTISVNVDPTNPGQFFACCGLFELADRLWLGAESWFADNQFHVASAGSLRELLARAQQIQFAGDVEEEAEEDEDDEDTEEKAVVVPLEIVAPVRMRLDWWQDINLKPWAGSMNARNIALAMCRAIDPEHSDPLNQSQVVPEVKEAQATAGRKKTKPRPKEPFHFDARRGANALGRDVGFIHDTLKKKWKTPMFAHPVVEFFALLGLQRARPQPTDRPRIYDYFTWTNSWRCQAPVLPLAVCGQLGDPRARRYRFANAFRTGQKKHKAYMPASPLPIGDNA